MTARVRLVNAPELRSNVIFSNISSVYIAIFVLVRGKKVYSVIPYSI